MGVEVERCMSEREREFDEVRRWKEALWMGFSMKEINEKMGVGLRTLRKLKRGESCKGYGGLDYLYVPWPDGSIGGMPGWKVKEIRSWNSKRGHMCKGRTKSGGYKL